MSDQHREAASPSGDAPTGAAGGDGAFRRPGPSDHTGQVHVPPIQMQTRLESDFTPMYLKKVGDTQMYSPVDSTGATEIVDSRRGLIVRGVVLFWVGYVLVGASQQLWERLSSLILVLLVSLFFAFALEPAVNRLAKRGWKRGRATAMVLFGVILAIIAFVVAIGALVATQVSNLLQNNERYISRAVESINGTLGTSFSAQEAIDELNRPGGPIDTFIENQSQSDNVIAISTTALNGLLGFASVLLFGYYLVADGPRLRRAICSRLPPQRQAQVLAGWELAISKTGGYLYSRLLLALISTIYHWVVFAVVDVPAPIPLAIFVGFVSQFLPVVGTYIAGVVPVVVTFFDRDDALVPALAVFAAIVLYQQVENYFLAPRISAATMEVHPAIAFAAALAGISVLGVTGAVLAVPTAAMLQALFTQWGGRHDVIDSTLTDLPAVDVGDSIDDDYPDNYPDDRTDLYR